MKEKINKKRDPLVRGSNRYKIIFFKRMILPILIVISIITISVISIMYFIECKGIIDDNFVNVDNMQRQFKIYGEYDSLNNASENNYIENVQSDYTYINNIGCKIKSFIISDSDFAMVLDFDFSMNKIKINNLKENISIYDENKNLYGIFMHKSYKDLKYKTNYLKNKELKKEEDSKRDFKYETIHQTENENTSQLFILSGETPFPRSSKLYVNIKDIGGFNKFNQYVTLYDNVEWNFELDVPEKFINRTNEEYKLSEEIEDVTMNKIEITDTRAIINYTTEKDNIKFRIIDENGKTYNSVYSKKIGDKEFNNYYNLNKNMLTEKMYLEVSYRDSIKKIELIK